MEGLKEKVFGVFIVLLVFVVCSGIVGYIETHYNRQGVVVEVNIEAQEVVVLDKTYNEWVFYGKGYEVGDTVTMLMFTNYTDNIINDDTIEKVKVNNN